MDDDTDIFSEETTSLTTSIIQVPSDKSYRSHDSEEEVSEESASDDNCAEDTPYSNTENKVINKKKKVKSKTKFRSNHVDMTPPDELLKKSEKKSRRYGDKQKIDKAMKEYIRCTALARIVYGDDSWKYAKAYADLAAAYMDLKGYFIQAQYHCETARKIMGGVLLANDETIKIVDVQINIHYTLGRALTGLKKYSEAEQALLRAEQLAKQKAKQGASSDSVEKWKIKIYIAIAKLSSKQQKHAMAEAYFDKSLRVLDNRYGSDSLELVPVYQSLGKVEQSKGKHADHERAIEYFTQAHSITAAKLSDSEALADTARALATAYSNVANTDAEISAEGYLNEALIIYQKLHGPQHKKTLDVQDELARLMIRTDRQTEGIELLKSTLPDKEALYGDFSSEVADCWKVIGSVYLAQGDMEKAVKTIKKCHKLECDVYGKNHKKTKDTERTLEILLANPRIAAKHSKPKSLGERPRFNTSSKT